MKMSLLKLVVATTITLLPWLVGCGAVDRGMDPNPVPALNNISPFETFKDRADYNSFLDSVASEQEKSYSEPSTEAGQTEASSEVETNNQVDNVDEGDIIKFSGDRLIILRDQHLLIFNIADENASKPVLVEDRELDTDFGTGNWGKGAWYDEMLVDESRIFLVAFRFNAFTVDNNKTSGTGAIELLMFNMDKDGKLDNGKRLFIESSDYYSGATNYATRLVDKRLVVYSPFFVRRWIDGTQQEYRTPYLLELVDAENKQFRRIRPAINYNQIYKGSFSCSGFTLHTIYSFDLEKGIEHFTASGVVGNYSHAYYVSENNLYLSIPRWWWCNCGDEDRSETLSTLYQFNIKSGVVTLGNVAEIKGYIPERFAMDERDGKIRMITQGKCSFDERPVISSNIYAIRLSSGDLSGGIAGYITRAGCNVDSVRFNGDYAVAESTPYLSLADFSKESDVLKETSLDLENIKLMQPYEGDRWVALGSYSDYDEDSGYYYTFNIHILKASSDGLERLSSYIMDVDYAWSEAFWNDHAFYFDPELELFGVPYSIWNSEDNWWQWQDGVQYFSMAGDELIQIGDGVIQTGDSCEECWYGNSRVVRRNENLYNLLGRQIKVTQYDPEGLIMDEVSSIELFE